jgi:cytochrome c biogenesis protein ResB
VYAFHGRLNEQTIFDDVGFIERTTYTDDSQRNSVDETTVRVRHSLTVRATRFYGATGKETVTAPGMLNPSALRQLFPLRAVVAVVTPGFFFMDRS